MLFPFVLHLSLKTLSPFPRSRPSPISRGQRPDDGCIKQASYFRRRGRLLVTKAALKKISLRPTDRSFLEFFITRANRYTRVRFSWLKYRFPLTFNARYPADVVCCVILRSTKYAFLVPSSSFLASQLPFHFS